MAFAKYDKLYIQPLCVGYFVKLWIAMDESSE